MFEIVARPRPDPRSNLVVREPEVLDELLVRRRLFQRVEVVAVQVLDERVLQRRRVVGLLDQGRDRLEPDPTGGSPSPFAGDELVAVARGAYQHRLEHAHLTDRVSERAQRLFVEVIAGLIPVGPDRRHGELVEAARVGSRLASGRDERSQTLTQSAASRHCSPLSPGLGTPAHPETSNRRR